MSTAPVSGSVPKARGSNGAVLVHDNAAAESMPQYLVSSEAGQAFRQNEKPTTAPKRGARNDSRRQQPDAIKRNRTAAEQH